MKKVKNWINENCNKYNLYIGIGYLIYFTIMTGTNVGEYTNGPHLITWWDGIWIPFIAVIFPMFIGFVIRKEKK